MRKSSFENGSAASGISDVEVVAEVEHQDSAVEPEIEVEAAQSRSARIRAAFREVWMCELCLRVGVWSYRRCQDSILQCRARGSGRN